MYCMFVTNSTYNCICPVYSFITSMRRDSLKPPRGICVTHNCLYEIYCGMPMLTMPVPQIWWGNLQTNSHEQRYGRGLTRVLRPTPSLRDEAHGGVLCTFSTRTSATTAGFAGSSKQSSSRPGHGPSGKAAWTVHHNTNLTRLGSLSSSHARRASELGHLSSLRPHWSWMIRPSCLPSPPPHLFSPALFLQYS